MRWIAPYLLLVSACTITRDTTAPTDKENPPLHLTDITTTAHSHDGTSHLKLHAAHATWHKTTSCLHATGPLTCKHTNGTLWSRSSAHLNLDTRRLLVGGPILHTITY